jgi:hypothetical protein
VLQEWLEQLPQECDDLEEPEPSIFPPEDTAQQVTSFSTLVLPHFSHFTAAAADMERTNFSNTFPHFRHL